MITHLKPKRVAQALCAAAVVVSTVVTAIPTLASGPLSSGGSSTVYPIPEAGKNWFQRDYPSVSVSVILSDSGTGIAQMLGDTLDVANASRDTKSSDFTGSQSCNGHACTAADLVKTSVGRDAIMVIVNASKASCLTSGLSKTQVGRVFGDVDNGGVIANWSDLGCSGGAIVPRYRVTTSGTRQSFIDLVASGVSSGLSVAEEEARRTVTGVDRLAETADVVTAVAANADQIGYVGVGYVDTDPNIVAIPIDGIAPTLTNVANGTFPTCRLLYMMYKAQASDASWNPDVVDYVNWYTGPKGQHEAAATGYVPLSRPASDCNGSGAGDHKVSIGDVTAIGLHWNEQSPSYPAGQGWRPEDCNYDAKVSIGDVTLVGLAWGAKW